MISRRRLITGGAAMSASALLAACSGSRRAQTPTRPFDPARACDDDPTLTQTEGPFFTPDTPEKSSFLADVDKGTKLVLTGTVLTTSCEPVQRALLDFWQADDDGNYDNQGYRLRGHLFTDAEGRYRLETIVPGLYTGRTRHIHVKVMPPGGRLLTTQLYFPDEPANRQDSIFRPDLVMDVGGEEASFGFVVQT